METIKPLFVNFLIDELKKRKISNSRYSLRAMARALEIEPAFLSKLMSGQRRITLPTFYRLARKLNLRDEEIQSFHKDLVNSPQNKRALSDLYKINELTLEEFKMISEWYHYAILELVQIEEFEPEPEWIAQALDISTIEAQIAMDRLLKLGYLEVNSAGKLANRAGNNSTVASNFTATAFRKLQKSVLEMAMKALEDVDIQFRDQSSITVATDPALLPVAKKKIKKFRRELAEFLGQAPTKKVIYHFGLSLYPISHTKRFETSR